MNPSHKFSLIEVSEFTGLPKETLLHFIDEEWISPDPPSLDEQILDDEDYARLQ